MKNVNEMRSDTRFRDFLREVTANESPAGRSALADTFLASLRENGYPIMEDDSTGVIVYQGEEEVWLLSDLGEWTHPSPMVKIPGTGLQFTRIRTQPGARIEYLFVKENEQIPFPDPLNPYRVNYTVWKASELAMPGYERHPVFEAFADGPIGGYDLVDEFTVGGESLDYAHTVHVFLPPDYENTEKRYPVVYFQDGADYIEAAYAPYVFRHLIERNMIEPLIGVFVTPPNRHKPDSPNRMTEYGLNDAYVRFFADELVPFIDGKYRTIPDASSRLVVGDSYGGLISVYIGLRRPDVFGLVYSQSGYFSFENDSVMRIVNSEEKKNLRMFIDIGIFEQNVGSHFLPAEWTDFLSANRRLRDRLEAMNYDFKYREIPEGHTWGNWRRHLIDVLEYYFPFRNAERM